MIIWKTIFFIILLQYIIIANDRKINWYKVGFEEIPSLTEVSGDHKLLAICDQKNAMIKVFDNDLFKIKYLIGNYEWFKIYDIHFKDNNTLLISLRTNDGFRVYSTNLEKQQNEVLFQMDKDRYDDMKFSENGKYFTALYQISNYNNIIEIWDVERRKMLYEFEYDGLYSFVNYDISYKAEFIVCKNNNDIRYYDLISGDEKYRFEMENKGFSRISCTSEIKEIIILGGDSIRMYNINFVEQEVSLKWKKGIKDRRDYVLQIPDNNSIIANSKDSLYVIDLNNGNIKKSIPVNERYVSFEYVSNNGRDMLICSGARSKVKNYDTFQDMYELNTHFSLPEVSITSDSKYGITYTFYDGSILWDIETGKKIRSYDFAVMLAGSKNQYYIIKDSTKLFLYDLLTDEMKAAYNLPIKTKEIYFDDYFTHCQLIPYVYDHNIFIYDLIKRKELATYSRFAPPLVFSRSNRLFAGHDYSLNILTIREFISGNILLEMPSDKIRYKVFSPDEKYFYTKDMSGEIKRYDIEAKEYIESFKNNSYMNYGIPVVPIPENKYLFENAHREFRIWDIKNNEILLKWNDWIGKSKNCVLSNNYKYVLAAYTDGSVVCYEIDFDFESSVKTQKDIYTLHPNPATSQINLTLSDEYISEPQIDIIDNLGFIHEPEYQINNREITINTSSLSSGVYFLRIRSGGQVETKKFVVVK